MSETKIARLEDRGVVRVTGEDALAFLDNLVTNDLTDQKMGEARFAALLTPQGKILFDFLIVRVADGYLLDVAHAKAAELVKRLGLYKLRAKVDVADTSTGAYVVMAYWGDGASKRGPGPEGSAFYCDPRARKLGWRAAVRVPGANDDARTVTLIRPTKPYDDYLAHRVALGVPEGGKDFAFGDTFPHEANMDRVAGVSFSKGCFVGQEVVARMQHKTVVRKRIVAVTGPAGAPLASGADIAVGEAVIGKLGTAAGSTGLALVRLDRVIEALDKGQDVVCDGQTVTVELTALQSYRAESAAKAEQKAARL